MAKRSPISSIHTPSSISLNVIPQISTPPLSSNLPLSTSLLTQQLHSPFPGPLSALQPNSQLSSSITSNSPQSMTHFPPPLPLSSQTIHKKGNRTGQQNWNYKDMIGLLDAVEAVLPFDDTHWEKLGSTF